MIGAVFKLIIFTSMVNRIINTSRNERVYDTYLQMFSLVPRFHLTNAAVLCFFLYKGTQLSETADTSV